MRSRSCFSDPPLADEAHLLPKQALNVGNPELHMSRARLGWRADATVPPITPSAPRSATACGTREAFRSASLHLAVFLG